MTKPAAWRSVCVGVAVLLASAVPAPGQTVSFIARQDFPAGAQPRSAAVADFDGDGVADLATTSMGRDNLSDGGVSVLLGNGDGTFRLPRAFAAGRVPWSVASADFNGDRAPDLAVANAGSDTVSVLLGNGDGTFRAALSFAAGTEPLSVVAGDFNRDGITDLATANSEGAAVLLANGDGTFQPMRSFGAGNSPSALGVGDFNGDGMPDLAVTNYVDGDVSVLSGLGNGNFLLTQTVPAGFHPYSLAVSDFNGDGIEDLAVGNLGFTSYPADVTVLLGAGGGTFQPGRHVALDVQRYSLAAGDFNGDGTIDLAAPGGVLLGNGDGTFQPGRYFVTGDYSFFVVVGKFNVDGRLDLAVEGDNSASVLLGNGDGTFFEASAFATGLYPGSVAVGDFNADGVPDLAVTDYSLDPETGSWGGTVSVLLGNGDGTFQPRWAFSAGSNPTVVTVADFNRDGVPDLAVVFGYYPGGVSVLLGNGDGTFQAAWTLDTGESPSSVAVGDFNRDGALDLAVANTGSQMISVLLGHGDGTFQAGWTIPMGANDYDDLSLATDDFNRDGMPDLAVARSNRNTHPAGGVSVLLGNGDGTFQTVQILAEGSHPQAVAVKDFNADGVVDLAVLKHGGVAVLIGNGDGTFRESAETFSVGTESWAWSVVVGDFNGDRRADVAVPDAGTHDVAVLLGNGDGTFQTAAKFRAGKRPWSAAVSDFNHDGKADLVVANNWSATVSVLINDTVVPAHDFTVVKDGSVTSDPAVTATFTKQRFTRAVKKNGIGRGTVTSNSDQRARVRSTAGPIARPITTGRRPRLSRPVRRSAAFLSPSTVWRAADSTE
jgi:hypothetical protein